MRQPCDLTMNIDGLLLNRFMPVKQKGGATQM